MEALTTEVSALKGIVDEIRTFQIEGNLDRKDILEYSENQSKNSSKILADTNEIKRDVQRVL